MDRKIKASSDIQAVLADPAFQKAVWNKELRTAQKIAMKFLNDIEKAQTALDIALGYA